MKEFIIRKRGKYVQRTCRIEEELLDKLEKLSFENNQSVNSIVNECISFALGNIKNEEWILMQFLMQRQSKNTKNEEKRREVHILL